MLRQHLSEADRLFVISVKYRGEVIATALYPHDQRCVYYWDGAYNPEYTHFSPNEMLHWTAMKLAIARGIGSFHIGGEPAPSRFSRKFGGDAVPYYIYQKQLFPMVEQCRRVYQLWSSSRDRASLLFRKTFGHAEEAPSPIALQENGNGNSEQQFKPRPLAANTPAIKISS